MVRVGIDLVFPERFRFIDTPGGLAFYHRVFTEAEQRMCGKITWLLAACFAAKEAVSKVLGTGLAIGGSGAVTCRSLEILNASSIEPGVKLHDFALSVVEHLGLDCIILRRSDLGRSIVVSAIGAAAIPPEGLRAVLEGTHGELLRQIQTAARHVS
jgi:phosphopantetheine--protein transferase-like protein